MNDQDSAMKGWQPWLTRRQSRMILEALELYSPAANEVEHHKKLVEWFDHEVSIHTPRK